MKQALSLALALVLSVFTYSQKFIITPKGLINADDSTKTFVVVRLDSATAKELYKRAYSYIQHTWKNPDFSNNGKVEGEFLHVKTYATNVTSFKANLGNTFWINLKYFLNLDFKDGKIRYEIVDLEMTCNTTGGPEGPLFLVSPGGLTWSIYKKDGAIVDKHKKTKDDLESYFNSQLSEFIGAIKSPAAKTDF